MTNSHLKVNMVEVSQDDTLIKHIHINKLDAIKKRAILVIERAYCVLESFCVHTIQSWLPVSSNT